MTVSYTCQKPIKFWAKCKINLLYKLNQSLLCVPGCPLLLATRLGTWAPFPLAIDLISSLMCLHKSFPLLPSVLSCLIGPFGLLASQPFYCVIPRFTERASQIPRKPALSATRVSAVLLCRVPVCSLWKAFMPFLSVFLHLSQLASDMCSLPFLPLSIHMFSI